MAEHDFRFSLLSPQHTLIECRALVPGRYQVTGNGGSIKHGDVLIVTLRGSKTLSMRLTVEGDARYSIRPAGQWVAMAQGPKFGELEIHTWKVNCDSCDAVLEFEFAVETKLTKEPLQPAATARIAKLGWATVGDTHRCPKCQQAAP